MIGSLDVVSLARHVEIGERLDLSRRHLHDDGAGPSATILLEGAAECSLGDVLYGDIDRRVDAHAIGRQLDRITDPAWGDKDEGVQSLLPAEDGVEGELQTAIAVRDAEAVGVAPETADGALGKRTVGTDAADVSGGGEAGDIPIACAEVGHPKHLLQLAVGHLAGGDTPGAAPLTVPLHQMLAVAGGGAVLEESGEVVGEAVYVMGKETVHKASRAEVYPGVVVGDADCQRVVLVGVDIAPERLRGLIGAAHVGIELTPRRSVGGCCHQRLAKYDQTHHQERPTDQHIGPVGLSQPVPLLPLLLG